MKKALVFSLIVALLFSSTSVCYLQANASSWILLQNVQLTDDPESQGGPVMIQVGSSYFVAFHEIVSGHEEIFVNEYDSSWNLIRNIHITEGSLKEHTPSISYVNGRFSVVFMRWTTERHIFVKEYDSDWSFIREVQLTLEHPLEEYPSHTFVNGSYFVAYSSYETGGSDVYVKEFDLNWNYIRRIRVTDDPRQEWGNRIFFGNDEWVITYKIFLGSVKCIRVDLFDVEWNFIRRVGEFPAHWRSSVAWSNNHYYLLIHLADESGTPIGTFVNRYDPNWSLLESIQLGDLVGGHLISTKDMFMVLHIVEADIWVNVYTWPPTTPEQEILNIIDDIESMNLQQGIDNSLDSKLESVLDSLEALNAGQRNDAINKLYAFINAVEAQRGNKITDEQADYLVSEAQRIIALIEG